MSRYWSFLVAFLLVAALMSRGNFAQVQTSVQNATRSVYWDKPLALPPDIDKLRSRIPVAVSDCLTKWQKNELAGKTPSLEEVVELRNLIRNGGVTAASASQIVCIISYLDGSNTARPLFASVVSLASEEISHYDHFDPLAHSVVKSIWPLHDVLFSAEEWGLDQQLLETLRPFESYGSGHSQWAGYVYAEVLKSQMKFSRATEAYLALEIERSHATEPSEGINRALDYEIAMSLCGQGRFSEALPRLNTALNQTGLEQRIVMEKMTHVLARLGLLDDAQKLYERYCNEYSPPFSEKITIATDILEARILRSSRLKGQETH